MRDAELSGVLRQGPQRPALGEEDEAKERVKRGRGERKEWADRDRERGERGKGSSNRVLPAPGGSRAGPRASRLAGPSQRPPPSAARLLDDARRARAARSRPRARAPATVCARIHGPASSRACHARSGLVARAPGPDSPRLRERGRGFCSDLTQAGKKAVGRHFGRRAVGRWEREGKALKGLQGEGRDRGTESS